MGVGVVRGSASGSYIDITGRPISISYNRPVYKNCAVAEKKKKGATLLKSEGVCTMPNS
jgi:hypothetical protein